jgi:hypothetical protein
MKIFTVVERFKNVVSYNARRMEVLTHPISAVVAGYRALY